MNEPLFHFSTIVQGKSHSSLLYFFFFFFFLLFLSCPVLAVMMRRAVQSASFSSSMENYEASPSSSNHIDRHSPVETPVFYSTMSADSFRHCSRTSSGTSEFSEAIDDRSISSEESPSQLPVIKSSRHNPIVFSSRLGLERLQHDNHEKKLASPLDSDLEMMKERFAKLLLGEDMSGSGKGVCTALTISNAITNLYATVFGHNLRLEPLNPEKKAMWKREMDCLLSVCNYMVEFFPTMQNLRDGTTVEIMSSRPRTDICINLPALRQLDAMLLEILDSFQDTEFWYAEQGSMFSKSNSNSNSNPCGSFRRVVHVHDNDTEEKWWLPVPCVPSEGLSETWRKHLQQKRDCAYQIHKAAMAINSSVLDEMDIPRSYLASLPKSGRTSIGDSIYRCMSTLDKFSPESLFDCLSISSEHEALELADRVESSMYTWRRKACLHHSKPSWTSMKEHMGESGRSDKNHILAERAETLLLCLKQRFPELSQTSLDTCKIQYNRDVGQAVLESYSRVLEGLAFNITTWIEGVLHVDSNTRDHQGHE
ncbi:hypothetical protein SAY86_010737 [Trapa natans]|uniref:PRONE domain-containing protein n=1 Tax=Trapa natans TaxID=22666 RepID=A0AAN7R0D9_TRANT|nr:hypothetical protein SAY86_010737 [Trapa natans]